MAREHVLAPSCTSDCAWCLLQQTEAAWGGPINPCGCSLQQWQPFFESIPDWGQFTATQHDPTEAWRMIEKALSSQPHAQATPMARGKTAVFGVQVKQIMGFEPTCACNAIPVHSSDQCLPDTLLELKVPPGSTMSLSELLRHSENGTEVEYKVDPCPACGKEQRSTKSTHLTGVGDVVLIALNRWSLQPGKLSLRAAVQDHMARRKEKGKRGKAKAPLVMVKSGIVRPDKRLLLGGKGYVFRAALVHCGRSHHSGHYLMYTLMGTQRQVIEYNDHVVSTLERLSSEVRSDARLLVYEKESLPAKMPANNQPSDAALQWPSQWVPQPPGSNSLAQAGAPPMDPPSNTPARMQPLPS
jgi:hypothetical protein